VFTVEDPVKDDGYFRRAINETEIITMVYPLELVVICSWEFGEVAK
jgi:hypothetical protein